MNLTQLRSLIAVAEAGSFTAAAEAIGVTQSGMSQALAGLEEALGVKLLVRQRHGVELTAFGERALDHARAALAQLEMIRQEAAEVRGEEIGSIRIAAFPSVFTTVLSPLLHRFRSLHPGIKVVALETDDVEVIAWLESGAVDLGVVLNPPEDSDAIPIGQDAWLGVLPMGHRFARRDMVSIAELAAEPFVLATGGCHVHARTLTEAVGLSLPDVRMEVRDWTSAIALVREGVGVGIVPESTLTEKRKGIRTVRLDPPLVRRFGLKKSPAHELSRASSLLIEMVKR
ncbi:LysR family transcriptional regulator [Rhizobium sp. S95]|uniref:LysR family transcriptional regulator n=1 Tax=Ciceribacter sichuanensis TaxID=2949647 RepID=A0AAJ1BXF0_9HYPH|nr:MULTISPECIES: LysR family transcriptional regulator [unclassified Ciceribacter]MCM2396157.1 LysR family transcriptional regulator [Ciceribacter sp. S95]MCM2402837.1 LysR family transcriptional regulator [Ciceribacter sp. S153]MCO5957692.1 LysR family transcriptional regulator [Ciceribacter sp. S101]